MRADKDRSRKQGREMRTNSKGPLLINCSARKKTRKKGGSRKNCVWGGRELLRRTPHLRGGSLVKKEPNAVLLRKAGGGGRRQLV